MRGSRSAGIGAKEIPSIAAVSRKLPAASCAESSSCTSFRSSSSPLHACARKEALCPASRSSTADRSWSTFCQRPGFIPSLRLKLLVEPSFCLQPLALDRDWRDTEYLGGFFDGQATEVPEFDDLALPNVDPRQPPEHLVHGDDFRPLLL